MNTARDYPSAPAGLAKRTPPPGTLLTTAKLDGRKVQQYGDENATAKFEHTAKLHEIENHGLTSGADDRLRQSPGLANNASPGTHSLHAFGHTSCRRKRVSRARAWRSCLAGQRSFRGSQINCAALNGLPSALGAGRRIQ